VFISKGRAASPVERRRVPATALTGSRRAHSAATPQCRILAAAVLAAVSDPVHGRDVGLEYRVSHVFRHSPATGMLNHGASLDEIGDLLRHQRADTTRIHAKVDLVLHSRNGWCAGRAMNKLRHIPATR